MNLLLLALAAAAVCPFLPDDDYGAKVEALLPGLGSENAGELNKAQDALFRLCAQAGAPGSTGRAAVCEAIAARLSRANAQARIWMLRQLERFGRAECVPAIAALLGDPDAKVADAARRALAGNPAREAADALAAALEKTPAPETALGLVAALNGHPALGPAHTRALLKHLGAPDEALHAAACLALGRTGDRGAAGALLDSAARGSAPAQAHAVAGCILLADLLVQRGEKAAALEIYRRLLDRKDALRAAAFPGLARAGGLSELDRLVKALGDPDPRVRGAAAEAAALLPPSEAVPFLTARLKDAPRETALGILHALGLLGHRGAVPALVARLNDPDEEIRLAATRALATTADAAAVRPLLGVAAEGGVLRGPAREALDRIRGPEADATLLAALKEGDARVRAEAGRALGVRRVTAAVSSLLKAVEESDPAVRNDLYKALAGVVRAEDLPALADLVARTADASDAAAAAVMAAASQIPDAARRADPVVAACERTSGAGRQALWKILGRLGGPRALEILRTALKDPDEEARKEAVRALSLWPDPGAAEDLLAIARGGSGSQTLPILALRGYIRLAGLAKDRPTEAVRMFRTALDTARRADEKRLALGGLGEVPDPEALKLVAPFLDDPELRNEAAAAAVAIGKEIFRKYPEEVRPVLEKISAGISSGPALQQALSLMGRLTTGTLDLRLSADPNAEKGLHFSYYEGDWDRLPDFDKLRPKKTGRCATFDISKRDQDDNFGFKFTGFLKIQEKGVYTFILISDDGSRLLIGDKVVVDNDGCHAPQEAMGKIELEPGMHPITVLFFEKGGGEELQVRGGRLK